jgi:hypothetical protein
MVIAPKTFWKACLLGVAVLALANPVYAGWMGFRNDTNETIVVQETIIVNGKEKPGRPQRLMTGEALRDTQCQGAQKQISIFNAKNTNVPLLSGNFACPAANENVLYIIKSDGKGGITTETVKTPVVPATPPAPPKKK